MWFIKFMLSWWAALVLVPLVVGLIYLHHVQMTTKSWDKTIEYSVSVIGAVAILYALLFTVQHRRDVAASQFLARWNTPDFTKMRVAGKIDWEAKKGNDPDLIIDLATDTWGRSICAFFEEVSIAIHSGVATESILKKFFKGPVLSRTIRILALQAGH